MYLCQGVVTKPVPSQESEQSCICGYQACNKPSSHVFVLYYQARKVSSHVFVLGYRYQACNKPGK